MSGIYHNYKHFVNRTGEIKEFQRLLDDDERRLLFIRGPRGIGKSGLLHFLIRSHRDQPLAQAFVDFEVVDFEGDEAPGKRREDLIYQLSRQLRGPFADLLDELDQGMPDAPRERQPERAPSRPAPSFDGDQLAAAISKGVAEQIAAASPAPAPAGFNVHTEGGAFIQGSVQAQTFVGRDMEVKVSIDNLVVEAPPDPGGGIAKAARRWERRTNRLFKDALQELLASNRVVLYFDHCEQSMPAIRAWLSAELLAEFHQPLQDTSRLRIVLVGSQEGPWEELDSEPDSLLAELELGGLAEKFVEEYWVTKLGRDSAEVAEVMEACGGVPLLMLQEAEGRGEAADNG